MPVHATPPVPPSLTVTVGQTQSFSSELSTGTHHAAPHVDISKGHRVADLTVVISPTLSRTGVELDGRLVAWDVRHREGGKTWTVRVRVVPLDGTTYRIVRHGGRVSIVPPLGLAPGQSFVTASG